VRGVVGKRPQRDALPASFGPVEPSMPLNGCCRSGICLMTSVGRVTSQDHRE